MTINTVVAINTIKMMRAEDKRNTCLLLNLSKKPEGSVMVVWLVNGSAAFFIMFVALLPPESKISSSTPSCPKPNTAKIAWNIDLENVENFENTDSKLNNSEKDRIIPLVLLNREVIEKSWDKEINLPCSLSTIKSKENNWLNSLNPEIGRASCRERV